ncbi:MAG: UDP-N-acetylmuramate--L-alanine ligase [Candidatus Doudnabacteria bacterium]|nr:UDP-N-acetylmuramate--L-alanine ligase [Candidatus Doudnabacteria bacterium]
MLSRAHKIFIVGIGGIGVSGLARVLRTAGKDISGSDLAPSELTEALTKEGIAVAIGHRAENLPRGCELLIYSAAVPPENPERAEGGRRGIKEMSYAEALAEFAKDKFVIAVSGTNGKTTTTAMLGWIMERAGLDPTVVVGSEVLAWKSNARIGKSRYLVIEADEYKRAFLNYHPDIAVITNIAADHLDYYRDLADVQDAFREFAANVKPEGKLVAWSSEHFELQVPGKFNQDNASVAAAMARALGIEEEVIRTALASFTGSWRRYEKVGKLGPADIISDYAHHPDGTTATMQAAAGIYKPEKTLIVFQPHQHNRTKMLFREFVKSFCESPQGDMIIVEIFEVAGREELADQNISSEDLVGEIEKCGKNVKYAANLEEAENKIRKAVNNYDAILFMGAGDIYKVANKLAT